MLRSIIPQNNNNIISLAESTTPSYTLTGTTAWTLIDTINITVPQTITPETQLFVAVSWSCNSSVGTKLLNVYLSDIGTTMATLFSDTETTNIANELLFKITFSGKTATAQLVSSSKTPGSSSTTAFTSTTFQLNYSGIAGQPLQMVFFGTLSNAADSMQIQRYSVWAVEGKAWPSNRLLAGQKIFWGGNAHFNDIVPGGGGITTAQLISCMTAMNMTLVRMAYENASVSGFGPTFYNTDLSAQSLVAMATALQGTGKQMYCCIDLNLTTDGTNLFTTEAAAYAYGFAVAQYLCGLLKPLGVTMFECGNELDTKNNMGTSGGGTWGYYPYQYNVAQWPIFRGVIHGAVDGVHASGCLAGSNACTVASMGALYNLWNGQAPAAGNNVTKGYPTVRWDWTAYHNYQSFGFLTGIQTYVSGPYVNIFQYLKEQFGVPIIISEFNGNGGFTEAQNATYCSRLINEAYNLKYKYNIAAMIVYQLFQGDPWGMIATPSTATLSNPLGTTVSGLMGSLTDTGN